MLDDAYQRLDVRRDLNIAVMSAETTRAVRWPLPAGPWREGWQALDRADAVDRHPQAGDARGRARRWPRSCAAGSRGRSRSPISGSGALEGLVSGRATAAASLAGKRVVAASGIADPDAFVAQIEGHRRRGAGRHLEGPPRLPRRGRRLAGARGPPGGPRRDHPEGRGQAARPVARRRPRSRWWRCWTWSGRRAATAIAAALDAVVTPIDRL